MRLSYASPEHGREVSMFESSTGRKTPDSRTRHHEQSKGNHTRIAAQVTSLVGAVTDLGNRFEEESADNLGLHSRDMIDQSSLMCLTSIKWRGVNQYRLFPSERLIIRS